MRVLSFSSVSISAWIFSLCKRRLFSLIANDRDDEADEHGAHYLQPPSKGPDKVLLPGYPYDRYSMQEVNQNI